MNYERNKTEMPPKVHSSIIEPKVHSFACWLETDVAPAQMDRFTPEVTSMLRGMMDRWRDDGLMELVETDGVAVWTITAKMQRWIESDEPMTVVVK